MAAGEGSVRRATGPPREGRERRRRGDRGAGVAERGLVPRRDRRGDRRHVPVGRRHAARVYGLPDRRAEQRWRHVPGGLPGLRRQEDAARQGRPAVHDRHRAGRRRVSVRLRVLTARTIVMRSWIWLFVACSASAKPTTGGVLLCWL